MLNAVAVHKAILYETKLTVIVLNIAYQARLWPQEDAKGPSNTLIQNGGKYSAYKKLLMDINIKHKYYFHYFNPNFQLCLVILTKRLCASCFKLL